MAFMRCRTWTFEVATGELCVLVGPSGGGKTTVLQMVNRLVEPSSGRVLVDGRDIATLDRVELRRRTGYVIQQPGLFPHLKVADNVASVPRLLGWDRPRVRARVGEMLRPRRPRPGCLCRPVPARALGRARRSG